MNTSRRSSPAGRRVTTADHRTRRWKWWWVLVTALAAVSTVAVVAAALWAGNPWKQVPFVVLTLWLGPALWPLLMWARQWEPRRYRSPAATRGWRRGGRGPSTDAEALDFPWVAKPRLDHVLSAQMSTAMGLVITAVTLIAYVSPPVRELWFGTANEPHPEPDLLKTLGMLMVGTCAVALGFMQMTAGPGRASIRVDAEGLTVHVDGFRSRLLWREVDGFTEKGGFLVVESAALGRRRAAKLNSEVGERQRLDGALSLWSEHRPRATVCHLKALTVPSAPLFDAITKHWGGEIAGRQRPQRRKRPRKRRR